MASFSGGTHNNPAAASLNAIVADVGYYATKLGWAGDDQPKSYFRSNVAVLRESSSSATLRRRSPIVDVRYDYYHRPIVDSRMPNSADAAGGSTEVTSSSSSSSTAGESSVDGSWEITNPVDPVTGLWYQSSTSSSSLPATREPPPPSSANANDAVNTSTNTSDDTPPAAADGSDWADLLPIFLRHGYDSALMRRTRNNSNNKTNNLSATQRLREELEWDFPLLLTEKSYQPPPLRQQTLQLLMEDLQVPAVFLAKDAVLECYACGRTQGTVVDVGYSGTTVSPVFEGYVETRGVQRAPIGLAHTDERLLQYLDQQAKLQSPQKKTVVPLYQVKQPHVWRRPAFHEAARLWVAQECRMQGAGLAINTTTTTGGAAGAAGGAAAPSSSSSIFQAPGKEFRLPDGSVVQVASQIRFQSSDILFGRPNLQQQQQQQQDSADGATDGTVPVSSPTTVSSHLPATTEQEVRQRLYLRTKDQWNVYLQQALDYGNPRRRTGASENERSHSKSLSSSAPDDETTDFSDAAAVGISKRRVKRQRLDSSTTTTAAASATSTPRHFSNGRLNYACHKYLQSLADQSLTAAPIAQMICEAAYRCDRDQQVVLLGNVIVGGGGACIGPTEQAVPDLLREQTEQLIHLHTPGWRVKVLAPGFAERSILPWLGGSILASLGSFHEMWITKADYDEWGSAIVNRKCP